MQVQIEVIGDFRVRVGDQQVPAESWTRRDAAALVKILALEQGHQMHRERMMDLLWPESDGADLAPRLHKAAHYARRALGGSDSVVLRGEMVSLFPGGDIVVDLTDFERAATVALRGGPDDAARVLDAFPAEAFPGDVYEQWAAQARERYLLGRRQLLANAERWEDLLAIDPADEQAHLALMRRSVAAGDRSAALRQFERMDRALRAELGVRPGPEAARLREQALRTMAAPGPVTVVEKTRIEQQIQFCRTPDNVTIAYAMTGSGQPLVKAANWLTHLDHDWHSPVWRHWLIDLSRRHLLVRYDERGCGLSDWKIPDPGLEDWVHDLETVVDAAGLETFDLLGISQGGAVAVVYAARHPERINRLVLYGTYAQGRLARATSPDDDSMHRLQVELARLGWGRDDPAFRQVFTSQFMPDGSRELWDHFNDLQRMTTSPENAAKILSTFGGIDVRSEAGRISAPTLVMHARHDQLAAVRTGSAARLAHPTQPVRRARQQQSHPAGRRTRVESLPHRARGLPRDTPLTAAVGVRPHRRTPIELTLSRARPSRPE